MQATSILRFNAATLRRAAAAALMAAAALAALRAVPARTEADGPFGEFVEPGFPFITTTVDAGKLGPAFAERNLSIRCVVLMLGNRSYACFDPDLLRVAAVWHGDFLNLTGVAQVSYNDPHSKAQAIPRIQGRPILTTGIYPGWMGEAPEFSDPRPAGPYAGDVGRGPLAPELGRWGGVYVVGDRAVLRYTVQGVEVVEQPGSVEAGGEIGFVRTLRVGPSPRPLTLVVAEVGAASSVKVDRTSALLAQGPAGDTVTAVSVVDAPRRAALRLEQSRYLTLRVPASSRPAEFRVVVWRGAAAKRDLFRGMLKREAPLADFARGGPAHWPEAVTTRAQLAPDTAAHVVDQIPLPIPNPWKRNVRVAGVDFFRDGRAALATFDGDVWIVSGLEGALQEVRWKRFASGTYEPLSLQVVDDQVYLFGREGIVRLHDLNGDGEADFYENFSNLIVQSGETREFPMDLVKRPGGGFYVALGGALDNGPKTSPAVMKGFRAGSRHSGTVVEVSADGRTVRTFGTGFREPFIGVHPRTGMVTASDQQGNFVPSTPLFVVREGAFHGVPATAHREPLPEPAEPLLWIPHSVDRSGASQVWVTDRRAGFGDEALIHLSYGRPGPFLVLIDSAGPAPQGAIVPLPGEYRIPTMKGAVNPRDGQLYLAGFQIWDSSAREISGLIRVRHTGRPSTLPLSVRSGEQGLVLRFATPLDSAVAVDPSRYHVLRWNYRRSEEYGSGHFRPDGSPGQERLPVTPHLSADRRSVLLVTPGMRDVMQMQITYDLRAAGGAPVASTAAMSVRQVPPLDLAGLGFGGVDWRASARRASAAGLAVASASSAQAGAQIYQRAGCVGCHSVDGGTEGKTGPTFRGLYGKQRSFNDGSSRRAYEDYLRQSILQPAAQVVRGYQEGMPSYLGVLSDAEIESVILYIRSLGEAGP